MNSSYNIVVVSEDGGGSGVGAWTIVACAMLNNKYDASKIEETSECQKNKRNE